ncbi:hypothetical protein BTT_20600 [Bacillus thuringiensis serovar morrisoni str. 4AA1]|nr:hypothetical protein proCM3_gp19 [Bacillus phage proCM3]UOC00871.1 hypothetical protein BTT_20600 [Bacillus thuringiensis serovar morrisoni str. 4AA1]
MTNSELKEAFIIGSGMMAFSFLVVYIMSYCITYL